MVANNNGTLVVQDVPEFDPERVKPFENQPRKRFRGIRGLAESIKIAGQATPGKVFRISGDPQYDVKLVDGERRLRACFLAGVKFKAVIVPCPDNMATYFEQSFVANFGREDHDVLEIATALAHMQQRGRTVKEMAALAGKSEGWVKQHLSLLGLHPSVQKMLVSPDGEAETGAELTKVLTLSLALLLVPLPQELQLSLAEEIMKQDMSVSAARRFVLGESRHAGHKVGYRGGVSARQINAVSNTATVARNRFGVFLDMPPDELRVLASNIKPVALSFIVNDLERLANEATLLAGRLKGSDDSKK